MHIRDFEGTRQENARLKEMLAKEQQARKQLQGEIDEIITENETANAQAITER